MLTAVSLFAGVGGFDLALDRAGVKVVAAVDIDKSARSVLEKHFPTTTIFNDVCEVTGEQLIKSGFEPRNGIITGGFPCQDLSVAGKRAGLEGSRSGLFWEICRILDETKTQYFILENVPGLLSSQQGADLGAVIGALVERGYGIAYRVLDAQYFGVPQRRRRVFIVGSLGDSGRVPAEILAIAEGRTGYLEESDKKGKDTPSTTDGSVNNVSERGITFSKSRRAQTNEDFETWVERNHTNTLNAFDNAHETRATELVIDPIVFYGNRVADIRIQDDKVNTLQARMGTGGNNMPMVAYPNQAPVRRLTPVECERLQGFPDGWTEGQADGKRYKQMGNAVAVPVVEWIVSRMVKSIKETQ